MKVIKAIYDNSTNFIIDIIKKFEELHYVEFFNKDHHKEVKIVRPIQTRFGTQKLPLIVFENENLEEIAAIWPETNPDWEKEIKRVLKEIL